MSQGTSQSYKDVTLDKLANDTTADQLITPNNAFLGDMG